MWVGGQAGRPHTPTNMVRGLGLVPGSRFLNFDLEHGLMSECGTESYKLSMTEHPDTSKAAAETVDTARFEELALLIISEKGQFGCTLDDLREEFKKRAPPNTQFVNRRTGLHQKGFVLDTGTRRTGESGRQQAVYVATSQLTAEWLEWIKNCPTARNPCLWEEGVKADNVDDETLLFYVLKHGVTAANRDLGVKMKRCQQVREAHLNTFADTVVSRHGMAFWQQANSMEETQ